MPNFRKVPVVVEAVKWEASQESYDAIKAMGCPMKPGRMGANELIIKTIEGDMTASKGDWIIKGIAGEFYPCQNDIFEKTYIPVTSDGQPVKSTMQLCAEYIEKHNPDGIALIAKERQEQIEKHGYDLEHDTDEHKHQELRIVAVRALTISDNPSKDGHYTTRNINCAWADTEDYICSKPYKERLIIAGALIAAEIDRLNHINEQG